MYRLLITFGCKKLIVLSNGRSPSVETKKVGLHKKVGHVGWRLLRCALLFQCMEARHMCGRCSGCFFFQRSAAPSTLTPTLPRWGVSGLVPIRGAHHSCDLFHYIAGSVLYEIKLLRLYKWSSLVCLIKTVLVLCLSTQLKDSVYK